MGGLTASLLSGLSVLIAGLVAFAATVSAPTAPEDETPVEPTTATPLIESSIAGGTVEVLGPEGLIGVPEEIARVLSSHGVVLVVSEDRPWVALETDGQRVAVWSAAALAWGSTVTGLLLEPSRTGAGSESAPAAETTENQTQPAMPNLPGDGIVVIRYQRPPTDDPGPAATPQESARPAQAPEPAQSPPPPQPSTRGS